MRISLLLVMLALWPPVPGRAQAPPLFSSDDVVRFTIKAPLEDILSHRDEESEEYPGIVLVDEGTALDTVEVDIRTRGRSRLDRRVCRFPPLRLDFPRSRVDGTLFEDQDKVKLVTHCRDEDDYEQDVLLEGLAYRMFAALTEVSFRVRVAHITYEDTGGDRDPVTRYGFLIEDEEAAAERVGWRYIPTAGVPPEKSDPRHLALLEIFQYMIGNADWSAFSADPGSEECCHNTKPVGAPTGPIFALPYDFDVTGFVDPRYGDRLFRANLERLGLNDLRQRRFRGLCQSQDYWTELVGFFRERREAIETIVREQEGLTEETRDEALDYLRGFYELLSDPEQAERRFLDECIPT
ncbi:MAG: hypothetical protein P8188_03420 [Gemmatimonadota bacterium]